MPRINPKKRAEHFRKLADQKWKKWRCDRNNQIENNLRVQNKLAHLNETTVEFPFFDAQADIVVDHISVPSKVEKEAGLSEGQSNNIESSEYIFIQISQLSPLMEKVKCAECGGNSLSLELSEKRVGFSRTIILICHNCGENGFDDEKCSVHNSKKVQIPGCGNCRFDINVRITLAFLYMGKGYNAVELFCVLMNMQAYSSATFGEYSRLIEKAAETTSSVILNKCRVLTKKYYEYFDGHGEELSDLKNHDAPTEYKAEKSIDVRNLGVSYDGSWPTKGFQSKHGFGCVIDLLTGFILDYDVVSKFCSECIKAATDLGIESPEFHCWYEGHAERCQIDHVGSSGAMEVAIAQKIWERSEKLGFRYLTMLSDGDSKTFNHLSSLQIYGTEFEIQKEECVNHVSKR